MMQNEALATDIDAYFQEKAEAILNEMFIETPELRSVVMAMTPRCCSDREVKLKITSTDATLSNKAFSRIIEWLSTGNFSRFDSLMLF